MTGREASFPNKGAALCPVVQTVLQHGENAPGKTALILHGEHISYRQLSQGIRAAAAYLRGKGVRKGDAVALFAEKSFPFFAFYFGSHLLGAPVLNLDADLKEERLNYIFKQLQPRLCLGPGIRSAATFESIELADVEPLRAAAFPPLESVADIMFTTGSTGEPKGVLLTHANIAAATRNINTYIGTAEEDTEVIALPICHSFGMGRVRCVLSAGGTLVPVAGFGNARKLYAAMREYRATGFAMVPAAWNMLSQSSGDALGEFAEQLRYIEIGSSSMPPAEKRRLAEMLPNTRICMHYGLTEASRSAFMEFHEDAAHADSVGRAAPNTEIRIYDEAGQQATGVGELAIRGEHVMKRYLGTTPAETYDGFFRTGDMGWYDAEGYLHLCGRIKEMINSGGKKISPIEVETLLNEHEDIQECACAGLPDDSGVLGEIVTAFIVLRPGVERIKLIHVRRFLHGKLEDYKLPMRVEMIEALPKTASGKLQRNKLKGC